MKENVKVPVDLYAHVRRVRIPAYPCRTRRKCQEYMQKLLSRCLYIMHRISEKVRVLYTKWQSTCLSTPLPHNHIRPNSQPGQR